METRLQLQRCGFSPASGRSPGRGNGNPLQHSCLGNAMDGGAWRRPEPGAAERLSTHAQLRLALSPDRLLRGRFHIATCVSSFALRQNSASLGMEPDLCPIHKRFQCRTPAAGCALGRGLLGLGRGAGGAVRLLGPGQIFIG